MDLPNRSTATAEGWTELHAEGSAGPTSGIEFSGLCPECSVEKRPVPE